MLVAMFNVVKVESVPLKLGNFSGIDCGRSGAHMRGNASIRHTLNGDHSNV
jgi:hypothetical protein